MTDTPPTIGLVLDCSDPVALAEFWATALNYAIVRETGNYVALVPDGRPGPKLLLQRVAEAKRVKNRMHVDIETPDIRPEAARLEAHGATRVQPDTRSEHGSTWILMADPEGNEFCVCDAGAGSGHLS
jgi:predicted enzyme related to lactoylglutathione lyase